LLQKAKHVAAAGRIKVPTAQGGSLIVESLKAYEMNSAWKNK